MSRKTDAVVARTIGIDTGKNMLHLFWQLHWPTSWRGSPGPFWRKGAATKHASSREQRKRSGST